ncbi:hypothetical protein P7K49_024685 [Saguinus oedipus]|uniref:Uncharacterized protein n=1 Tax=Saguinus oedipus TaxID=9490 RepID=A0ABQ9UR11_SAGOE|nr:hypothetical protein P7K49_024685 [Saguinus oedipus]
MEYSHDLMNAELRGRKSTPGPEAAGLSACTAQLTRHPVGPASNEDRALLLSPGHVFLSQFTKSCPLFGSFAIGQVFPKLLRSTGLHAPCSGESPRLDEPPASTWHFNLSLWR